MDRDEYLAREVMQWHKGNIDRADEYPGAYHDSGDKWIMPIRDWNPGESWPQTGMLLETMEKDFYITVTQYWDYNNTGSEVVFRQWESGNCGRAKNTSLREAIATAAARAKGWVDGMG